MLPSNDEPEDSERNIAKMAVLSEVQSAGQSSYARHIQQVNSFVEFNKTDIEASISDRFERQDRKSVV